MKIKVLVVDDNAGLVGLIREYFTDSKDIEIVGSASNGEEAVDIFESKKSKRKLRNPQNTEPRRGAAGKSLKKFRRGLT